MRPPTRVGIATGLVVVSDLIGSGACQEQAIVGETPGNLSLLQNLATNAMPATISPPKFAIRLVSVSPFQTSRNDQ